MKRFLKNLVVTAAAASLVAVGAPTAQAQGLGPCTFAYADDLSQTSMGQLVTYTPLATVTVHGDAVIATATYVVGATQDYVRCLMWRG